MVPNKKTARTAGLLYLVVVLTGLFSLMYVPSKLIVWENASTTFSNISSQETLFRLGILAGVLCYTAFLFLPIVLYRLLSPVNKAYSIAMLALALISVPISFVNLLNKFSILTLIGSDSYLNAFDASQLPAQVLLHLDYYNNGVQLASIFWGLWLFPFGYLVYRSGFLPKILGILLMAGCFGYLVNFTGRFLYPGYGELGISTYISLPASLGEIGTCLWLLIVGVSNKKTPDHSWLKQEHTHFI